MKRRRRNGGREARPKKGGGKADRRRTRRTQRVDLDGVLQVIERRGRRPITAAAIGRVLGIQRDAARRLKKPLTQLLQQGSIERVAAGYRMCRRDGLVEGTVEVLSRAGSRDLSVVRDDARREWSVHKTPATPEFRLGDRVLLLPRTEAQRGRKGRGEILHVLDGAREGWLGLLQTHSGGAVVLPYYDDADWSVQIESRHLGAGRDGDVVVAAPMDTSGSGRKRRVRTPGVPRGRVTEVLGRPGDAEADTRAIAWRHRWPLEFTESVIREATAIPEGLEEEEVAERRDLRDRCFVTIDPESARDFDDAVCAEPRAGGGTCLWVAVADVAHFVVPGSAVDVEALARGFSVYFPERAIPMLPERLSSNLCSLRPGVDRLAMVVEMAFDAEGKRVGRRFHQAVIRSHARLSYAQAASRMDAREAGADRKRDEPRERAIDGCLAQLFDLAARLERRRSQEGYLELQIPEPEVVIDPEGRVVDVVRASRASAHGAVEEAMLAANRAVAEALAASDHPAIRRVHPPPSERAAGHLREVLLEFGLEEEAAAELSPRNLARALQRVEARPERAVIHGRVLQSLSQAHYSVGHGGHFALGFGHYTHFTSPIRRYADLMVHRALKSVMQTTGESPAYRLETARRVARRTSWRERLAIQAERDRVALSRCALMAERVGQRFEGVVTGVASHGLYVALDAPFVEGMVHVSQLRAPTRFDERRRELSSGRPPQRFRMGDRIRVELVEVDARRARIGFALDLATSPGKRRG
ncbi:VacB/RNase II family 3'-5' exoribonuclease [Myxococcota bacterium]|nr:VacB/RNase II family 3'-5' exoribonuclease [Myxococcota bacterium]